MSAQEIIEQIKGMPANERQEVVDYVREFQSSPADETKRRPDWNRIIQEVFDEHDELFRKLAQ